MFTPYPAFEILTKVVVKQESNTRANEFVICENRGLLESCAVSSGRYCPTFERNFLPPASRLKLKAVCYSGEFVATISPYNITTLKTATGNVSIISFLET